MDFLFVKIGGIHLLVLVDFSWDYEERIAICKSIELSLIRVQGSKTCGELGVVYFSSLSLKFSRLALCFEDPNHAGCAWKFSVSTNFVFRFKDTDEEMEHMFPDCLYQMSQEYDTVVKWIV